MKDTNIDLNKLLVFRELAEAKSFTKAAEHLKQPKSRISRTISSLEKELGVQLIYRTTRSFQLTQSGARLLTRLTPILSDLKSSLEMVVSDTNEIAGVISLTAPEDIATELLGNICQEFMEMYPKIQIKIHASNVVMNMLNDQFDLAIRIGKQKDSSLIQKKLGTVDLAIVMSNELYQKYKPRRLEDLEKIPYLSYEDAQGKVIPPKFTKGKDTKTLKFSPHFSCNNFFLIRLMTLRNAGVAIIPSFLVRDSIVKGELIPLFREWKNEGLPIQIMLPQQKEIPLRLRKFIDFLAPKLMPYF